MKIVAFTDLQATDGHEKCFADRAMPLQRWRVKKFYTWLRETYQRHGCQGIWDLGDTLDDRTSVPLPTLHVVHQEITQLPTSDLNIKLVGNHEQYLKSPEIHSGGLFQSVFNVVDTKKLLWIRNVPVLCVAFHDKKDEQDAVQWIKDTLDSHPGAIVLAHAQIVGSQMPSGSSNAGWPKHIFEKASLTLLGHIHRPQSLTPTIHYIGSPFQQDHGESGEKKRVALVDVDNRTVEWIPVEGFPEYRTTTWAAFKKMVRENSEDRFKVVLTSMDEAAEYYQHPLNSRALPEYSFTPQETTITESSSSTGLSSQTRDILTRYIERNPPAGITLDDSFTQSDLVNFGLEIGNPTE